MRFLAIGGDVRYAYLVQMAIQAGMDMAAVGQEHARGTCSFNSETLERVSDADALIMPNPWRLRPLAPNADEAFTLDDVLANAKDGVTLIVPDGQGMPEDFGKRHAEAHGGRRLEIIDLSGDEAFLRRNAALTAEGALCAAMERLPVALMDCECLVVGYGRIGRALTARLLALQAAVTVCARRAESRREAEANGARSVCPNALELALCACDVIFTTVPARVFGREALKAMKRGALLMDLASLPYGFDLPEAEAMGLYAVREGGLPGRHCPQSAAKALLEAVRRAVYGSGGD